ncbi:hypothetical protein [Rhodoplanes elegans]|nr:hypothetical protein [Rhodoplanes elegans]
MTATSNNPQSTSSKFVGFWKNVFIGEVDPHPAYEGMPETDRRRPEERKKFLVQRAEECSRQRGEIDEKLKNKDKSAVWVEWYLFDTLHLIYKKKSEDVADDKIRSDLVPVLAYKFANASLNKTSNVNTILGRLKESALISAMLPEIFSEPFLNQVEESRTSIKKKKEDDKVIVGQIEALRKEIRDNESPAMQYAMAGDTYQAYAHICRIESCQRLIREMKRKLNYKINDSREDTMRTG